jgi:hypothetical protein
MSRHEWERGEIKFSTKEFTPFRHAVIRVHNEHQTQLFNLATEIYGNLKLAAKGKRGFDFASAFQALTTRIDSESAGDIYDAIFPYEKVEKLVAGQIIPSMERREKPLSPKKNQFPLAKQNAERIDVGSEAGIGFDKKRRVVIWSVAENNHAVERAHEHKVGAEFFRLLSRVNWTRGTGGEIAGNDEYNQESRESGSGANYVTHRFGAAEKQFKRSLGVR